jgi:hypothetical protein
MKAEINNENKARFFGLYFGQKIFASRLNNAPLWGEVIDCVFEGEYDCPIELKPLSSISDEDLKRMKLIMLPVNQPIKNIQVDYLRSKGYALPWMGLSVDEMVEAGWIKLIEA